MTRPTFDTTRREIFDLAEACATAAEHLAYGYACGGCPTPEHLARATRYRALGRALLAKLDQLDTNTETNTTRPTA